MSFGSKKFRSKREQLAYDASLAGKYYKRLKGNPFLYFGLPFLGMMVISSYWLAGFTAIKYERDDRHVQEMNEEELTKLIKNRRKFDIKDEFYRLQGLAEEDWEPKRVERLDDESENVW
ncbi:hypothetical protein KAFR_0J01040 [Kazachstania africana CBS 2517]|uniref:Cytochrome c oxidase assembly protein COX16, mitochondrial n=1 Tax=Kazachstania africana (strain ATCC 22294 / BCRC 22015 / CBS 2517 / CECT 1963 / NBRC 1671 / NRRL Y-8276) TaxID=1071382 RepID=H2B0M2_KAZAF|nr:hypothetical protein KAFR_0J01040 [Kazachstania africana CBS 2517]CCF60172.1 hypothetical protein KAFR_0J01040 [Kazachstania africana CBS 2517]